MKYQIGSAIINRKETIILFAQECYIDFASLMEQVQKELDLNEVQMPVSLLQLMQEWAFWNRTITQALDLLFNHNDERESDVMIDASTIQWLPPLMYPNKLICIGVNYRDHIAEMGSKHQPQYPYSFLKPPSTTLKGCGETIMLPERAKMIDWEAELAVVIGTKTHLARGQEAISCIAGYTIFNDLSARDWRSNRPSVGTDWVMTKAFDGFGPIGPLITPKEFVPDPQNLEISLKLNGETKQHSNTGNMIFSVKEIIEHLSSIMTLEPGDVIATGTPAGVGSGRTPPEFIQSGDRVVLEIEGLGCLENVFK